MASSPTRVLWKGAISFGLVHIPVALHAAVGDEGLDFDWLDKRSMDPVGYKRVNKKTGREITKDNIVKGIEYEDGHYVVLSPEEINAAYPKSTQTIEIETFVGAGDIPFVYLERPYYLAPIGKGAKVYALLREALLRTGRVGIARVIIQTRQHLAVLVPSGPALVLNLLRWSNEIRNWDTLNLPAPCAKALGLSPRELEMAEQLIKDMSSPWKPEEFRDSFRDDIMKLVHQKVKAGKTQTVVQPLEGEAPGRSADIIDLTELLKRSLRGGKDASKDAAGPAAKKAAPGRAAARRVPAKVAGQARKRAA